MREQPELSKSRDPRVSLGPAILARLEGTGPGGTVPFGMLSAVAAEFGVSPQRVAQITKQAGIRVCRLPTRRVGCAECGTPLGKGNVSGFCRKHVSPPLVLTCVSCGHAFERNLSVQRAKTEQRGYRPDGRVWCARGCFQRVLVTEMERRFPTRQVTPAEAKQVHDELWPDGWMHVDGGRVLRAAGFTL